MKWGEGQFGEEPFGGGLVPDLAGRCEATAALGSLDLRRRVALWATLTTGFTGSLSIQVDTPLRAAPMRALRVMSGARVA